MEALLEKLRARYGGSMILESAEDGDWAGAAEWAAKYGIWGIWEECRAAAGLPATEADRAKWLTDYAAARKARFAK